MNPMFNLAWSPYAIKDQAKSDLANCFIGRGTTRSSTYRYMIAWGDRANKGTYTADDVVFVSAEGARFNRRPAYREELEKACNAGAAFITDTILHRSRPYNVGEREVAEILIQNGYVETYGNGHWHKKVEAPPTT